MEPNNSIKNDSRGQRWWHNGALEIKSSKPILFNFYRSFPATEVHQ